MDQNQTDNINQMITTTESTIFWINNEILDFYPFLLTFYNQGFKFVFLFPLYFHV